LQGDVALSKLVGHLGTKHDKQPIHYPNLGAEIGFSYVNPFRGPDTYSQNSLSKVNNDLEFIVNRKSYDANAAMFWVSLCGTPKEAKEYEFTIKIESFADKMAGRTKFLLIGTGNCLSCDESHDSVKKKVMGAMLISKEMVERATEGNDENRLYLRLVIQKK